MKLEFSLQVFEKMLKIKFHENPSSESRDVPYGLTDKHEEANNRFSEFLQSRLTRDKHPCSQTKSNPPFQQSCNFRPTTFDRPDTGIGHLSC